MTENKRFEIKIGEFEEENIVDNLIGSTISEISDMCKKMNELHEDLMNVRAENTRNKLVLMNIVEDLEKQAESKEPIIIGKEYVEWIKQNVVLDLQRSN